jgi:hypothetical protein
LRTAEDGLRTGWGTRIGVGEYDTWSLYGAVCVWRVINKCAKTNGVVQAIYLHGSV